MPDLNQPLISKISRAHFFVAVIVWRIVWINDDMPIVVGRSRIVTPYIGFGYLMVGVIAPRGQMRVVSKDLTDLEDASRRSSVTLLFLKSRFILTSESPAPGDAIFSKEYRERSGNRSPSPAARTLK